MGEPQQSMHNFAYHPNVANWVQSTSLAQLDDPSDQAVDEEPDAFYQQSHHYTADHEGLSVSAAEMASSRQRQQAPNGTARAAKPAVRSVSGPASSTASTTRAALPGSAGTVKSLAQKFNQVSTSTDSSPTPIRIRSTRPSASPASTAKGPPSSSFSPARPAKQASYGNHTFNNLKPRERPQPAPASPAGIRRTNGRRTSVGDQQTTPSRQKVSSPTRGQKQAEPAPRQPFFGEVIGEHDEVTPGFGISTPAVEPETREQPEMGGSPRHRRERSDLTNKTENSIDDMLSTANVQPPRRLSPPSRIPVASQRRSIASDSGSSTRSFKATKMRPPNTYQRASPTRLAKSPPVREKPRVPSRVTARRPVASPPLLPATRYGHSRGKSPQGSASSTRLNAVISVPPQPTSPRLRHSRESGLLSPRSSESRSRSVDPRPSHSQEQAPLSPRIRNNSISVETPQHSDPDNGAASLDAAHAMRHSLEETPSFGSPALQLEQPSLDHDVPPALARHNTLKLHTAPGEVTHPPAPRSSTTDFEADESPVLGMPGSFMMTPPIAQNTSPLHSTYIDDHAESQSAPAPGELLQARTFQPSARAPPPEDTASELPRFSQSELSLRESIPIMFAADEEQRPWEHSAQSPLSDVDPHRWRAEPLDSSGTIAYLDEIDDSPTDPFCPSNRDSLQPDDSASMAFYHRPGPEWTPRIPPKPVAGDLTLDSEAYSVINKILNMYTGSSTISPEMAYDSQRQIHKVSPIIAQHQDWGSKETTETYLARLLSDATARETRDGGREENVNSTANGGNHGMPSLTIQEADEPSEAEVGGTAVIFPTESRRYSRGSRGSRGSTATTIQDDASRPDSASMAYARDAGLGDLPPQNHHTYSNAPQPPPKDWWSPTSTEYYYNQGQNYNPEEPPKAPFGSVLPEIQSAGEGLGLSLHANQQYGTPEQQYQPPRPPYSPPPPPIPQSTEQATMETLAASAYTPSLYGRQPPSSILSSMPIPAHAQGISIRPPMFNRGYTQVEHHEIEDPAKVPYHSASDPAIKPLTSPPPTATSISTAIDAQSGANDSSESVSTAVDNVEISPALRKRHHIVKELINTECGFACDMMVVYEIFQKTSDNILDDRERRTLFSNSQELSKFSYGLYRALKRAVKPILNRTMPLREGSVDAPDAESTRDSMAQEVLVKELADTTKEQNNPLSMLSPENDRFTTVGAAMNEHLPKMERLYTTYLLNNDDATEFLIAHGKTQKILGWQMACIKGAHGLTQAWDLNSLIVKPVQRLLKYPLLLTDLLGCTPEDHPDYPALKAARDEVIKISERVNSAKKRQDTLREATKEGKKKESKAPRGKNWVKALSGKSDKTKTDASIAKTFDDPQYNYLAQKFGGHFFQLQIVLRDVEKYLDDITGFMVTTNSLILGYINMLDCAPCSDPIIESTWRRQAMAFVELQTVALEDHKSAVRVRIIKPILELWNLHSRPQKLMEQRKKGLTSYVKFKQASDRKEKMDSKTQEAADTFMTINNTLKDELPQLYTLTKQCIISCLQSFILYQNAWWKNCQKKILPLLEYEPEHTTSFSYDLKAYVDRFQSDFASYQAQAMSYATVNRSCLADVQKIFSPVQSLYSDEASSRKSSSRRTESIGSDISTPDPRNRRSDGFTRQRTGTGTELPTFEGPPRSSPQNRYFSPPVPPGNRVLSPISDKSDDTVTQQNTKNAYTSLDGTLDDHGPQYAHLPQPEYLMNMNMMTHSAPTSYPNSHRGSAVFNSALPMSISDSPTQFSHQITHQLANAGPLNSPPYQQPSSAELPGSPPADMDEPEVLFLAASLFEFNIAHDRREGGIPYLVYVPGEIFDVIGMKGELWLARNQDDGSRTVGWIWEKHFARILPEDA